MKFPMMFNAWVRVLLVQFLAPVMLLVPAIAAAQDYPNRSVRIMVPYAAGGQPDIAVRVIAQNFSNTFGQPFVVENIPGSSGVAAINALMKAPADGYTLLHSDGGNWAIFPSMSKNPPYDALRDFAPVGLYGATTGLFLAVNSSVPAANLQELVKIAKAKPGALSYASAGIGSIHHLIMEDFKVAAGVNILHVPYKGSAQAVPALVGGQVSMGIASLAVLTAYAKDGRVRIVSVSTKKRSALAQDIPTMSEAANLPDFEHGGSLGLVARVGTPRPIVDRLSAALSKVVALPDTVTRFHAVGLEPVNDNRPEALIEQVRYDLAKYAKVVKLAGIVPE